MAEIVIAVYHPKPGQEERIAALVARHVPLLKARGLVTPRAPIAMRSAGGALVEVFEWVDAAAAGRAHADPEVAALWAEMGTAAEFRCLADLPEATRTFPHFAPLA